jgi:hypothetical protein
LNLYAHDIWKGEEMGDPESLQQAKDELRDCQLQQFYLLDEIVSFLDDLHLQLSRAKDSELRKVTNLCVAKVEAYLKGFRESKKTLKPKIESFS